MRHWTTKALPVHEQYSYWREVVCAAFTPLCPAARATARDAWDRRGVPGWVDSMAFGAMNGAEVESCDQVIRHGRAEVRAIDREVVFVNLQLRGRSVVQQDDRTCMSGPGTFSLVDATRPFHLDYLDDWRVISFRVPAGSIPGLTAPDRAMTARTFNASSGLAGVLGQTMRSLWKAAPELDEASAAAGAEALGSLLVALLQGGNAAEAMGNEHAEQGLRDAIDQFMSANIEHADLSPQTVARQFAISVRKLHQLYGTGPRTFSQTVMGIRAASCAESLVSAGTHSTLTETAARWGFSDLSHMNRVFRRELGCLPSEYRAREIAQGPAPAAG
jgi:AraC family transcriptional regulator, positive regulator of tynA and feaB